ncbi:MAG TPA: hypothetical protein VFA97_13820 [Gaiellaceae bacterium]|nr:hypothetical protein [Gaiellaceae bacterium]
MTARLLHRKGLATFAVLVAVAEVAGRSATAHVDRALHVAPLARTDTSYYPFLLVGVKVVGALTLAALVARGLRAWAAADAGSRLLAAAGHRHDTPSPRLRPGLSPRVWAAAFAATSVLYLVHSSIDSAADGKWSPLAPWLHTYALPVFAVVAVLVALVWRLASWLHAIEDFADRTLARVRRILTSRTPAPRRRDRPADDAGPRRRFGLAFESRPPPLPA